MGQKNNFTSTLLSSSGWTNQHETDSQERMYYIWYIQGLSQNMRPEENWAVEAYVPFWAKEREAEVWDFKRKVGNS